MLLGVRFHGNLGVASAAFEVEAVDFDAKVVLVEARLLSHIKFRALI